MARSRYVVCYDISDQKRLRRVYHVMCGFGDPLQYSVFACDLSPSERVLLETALVEAIHEREDRVLIVDTGPADGRGEQCMKVLGRQHVPKERRAIIV